MKRFLIVLMCLAALGAGIFAFFKFSKSRPAENTAAVETKKPAPKRVIRRAKPVIAAPKTMDITASQKTPLDDPNIAFILQPLDRDIEVVRHGHSEFDSYVNLAGKDLKLRGITVRKYEVSALSLLNIYTVAYYVDENTSVDQDVPDQEMVLILEYHVNVEKEKVVQAIKDNVRENPNVDIAKVEPLFQQLADAFDSPKKGDRYEFTYIPGRGTAMIKAGRIMTVVPTIDFQKAFFGIWLSPHGKDVEMRCELLALPCPKTGIGSISSNLTGATKEKLSKLKKFIP